MDNPHPPGSPEYYREIARQARETDRRLRGELPSKPRDPALGVPPPCYADSPPRARYRSGQTAAVKRRRAAEGRIECEVCGWRLPRWLDTVHGVSANHAHHVIPVKHGGSDDPSNFAILCPNHHAMAHRYMWGHSASRKTPTFPSKDELIAELKRIEEEGELYLVRSLARKMNGATSP